MTEFSFEETKAKSWLDRPLASLITLDWEKAIYLAFILIAIISRFYGLGDRVVSHDESLHTQYSYQYYNGDGYSHTPLMHGPFLFHATAASYWLFGDNDFSSRVPVALLGILLVVMPYFLRSWLGRAGALFASFFLLVSPYIVYYSRYIRHDIYIIVWAMIVFTATVYYTRRKHDHYLWWFAGGVALMFATKEVSFIYVATFGSFLILRTLARMTQLNWAKGDLNVLRLPIAIVVLGGAVLAGGFLGVRSLSESHNSAEVTDEQRVAADPNEIIESGATEASSGALTLAKVAQVSGLIAASVGLFLVLSALRPRIEQFAEFDLIVLYAALVLPTTSALLSVMAGVDPRSFALNSCAQADPAGSVLGNFFANFSPSCFGGFVTSPIVINSLFLVFLVVAGIALGYWWGGRRFLVSAVIFHVIFGLFYTSLFTNNGGWYSGMVLSLGYWLEQQEVARGGQPAFYYLFVTPFYEFLPIIFSGLAMRFWLRSKNLSRTVGYWTGVLLATYLTYAIVGWLTTRPINGGGLSVSSNLIILLFALAAAGAQAFYRFYAPDDRGAAALASGMTTVAFMALLVGIAHSTIDATAVGDGALAGSLNIVAAAVVFVALVLYFFAVRRRQIEALEVGVSWRERFDPDVLTGFVPHLIWWLLVTWAAYSYAGEKMPWLSTHMVIPTALLAGWYLGEKTRLLSAELTTNRRWLMLVGVATVSILIGAITLQTVLIDIDFGSQTAGNLRNMGVLFGRIAVLLCAVYGFQRLARSSSRIQRQGAWLFGSFVILAALTIRFTYMANYVNGDYSNEFLVYAHGSPATKQQVMRQLDEVSMRLEGDKSVRVSFDNKSSWPYYWYLREYTNQHFFGENPDATIADSPVIIAGSSNWEAVENIVRDDYEETVYSYIWWPMEEYRDFSWSSLFGITADPATERGLGSRAVRQALWDIFLYRDYENYANVFGGTYNAGDWPLRSDLKLYIRRDVLGKLWDSGATATAYEPPVDPYALGEVTPQAEFSVGSFGTEPGQLNRPRNVAVAPDGRIYVADTGNHRIQVFDVTGAFSFGFGGPTPQDASPQNGEFNEPWGITIDDAFVYVADTWNGRVQKFTLEGEYVSQFGSFAIPAEGSEGALEFYGPRSIAVNDGKLYIIDTGNHRIQVVDVDGNYLDQVGGNGFGLGEFNEPVGLTIDTDGTVYVAEAWSNRVQSLSSELDPFYEWQVDAWDGVSLDNKPYIASDGNNRIYLTDPEGHQVLIFNAIGEYLGKFGRFGSNLSQFDLPTGIATDTQNNVYVADANNHRILKFAPVNLSVQTGGE